MIEKIYSIPHRIVVGTTIAVFKREHDVHPFIVGIPTGSDKEGEQWYCGDYYPTEQEAVLCMFRRGQWDVCKTPLRRGTPGD